MPAADSIGGYRFADPGLLTRALTHRSAGAPHNERLEFLGDAMLNLVVAEALFRLWPRADEGTLTRARAELVREPALARLARRLDLGPRLKMGPGEMKSGGYRRDSVLADALEAVIAAVWLDAGFERCRQIVLDWLQADIAALPSGRIRKDAKTRLQEHLQAIGRPIPTYSLRDVTGAEHDPLFLAECMLPDTSLCTRGSGGSRRAAEQAAAHAMLLALGEDGNE